MSLRERLSRFRFGLRTRLILILVSIFGVTMVGFSAVLYFAFVEDHQEAFDSTLYNYTVDIANAIEVNLFGEVILNTSVFQNDEKVFPFALGDTYVQLRNMGGITVARSRNLGRSSLPFKSDDRDSVVQKRFAYETLEPRKLDSRLGRSHQRYRLLNYYIDRPGGFDFILQVAAPMVALDQDRKVLITFFSFSIPAVLLIAVITSILVSRRALRPVKDIIATTRFITARKLSARVPVPQVQDEVRELAETLNGLLDRLEQSFQMQESFIADASHQLRTPLSILKGEIDLMNSKPRSAEEVREFLESAGQEVSYLTRTVNDLLVLARVDAGVGALSFGPTRVDEVFLEMIARVEKVAHAKNVRLDVQLKGSEFEITSDPDLMRCLMENLAENAVKYSPEGKTVCLTLAREVKGLVFEVKDEGPGIDPQIRDKIFNRFYRSESTRDKVSGSGLGLAIVKRIADVHSGRVEFDTEVGRGTTFKAFFPVSH